MTLMACGVLTYGLVIAVHRNGRDLSIARALGLTPRLLRRTGRWAGTVFATAALVVAVPVGVVLGRVVWRAYAEDLGVVPDPVTTVGEIGALVPATLFLAALVGTLAAARQSRTHPGAALRSE